MVFWIEGCRNFWYGGWLSYVRITRFNSRPNGRFWKCSTSNGSVSKRKSSKAVYDNRNLLRILSNVHESTARKRFEQVIFSKLPKGQVYSAKYWYKQVWKYGQTGGQLFKSARSGDVYWNQL